VEEKSIRCDGIEQQELESLLPFQVSYMGNTLSCCAWQSSLEPGSEMNVWKIQDATVHSALKRRVRTVTRGGGEGYGRWTLRRKPPLSESMSRTTVEALAGGVLV